MQLIVALAQKHTHCGKEETQQWVPALSSEAILLSLVDCPVDN